MSADAVQLGDKLHIITRRMFPEDLRRHFAGEVVGSSDGLYKVSGYTFVLHHGTGEYRRRPDVRTRILSLADAGYIVTGLPQEVDVEALEYKHLQERLVVTDSKGLALDINEFGSSR